MKAVILAAGRGARLKEMTENRPKPMVEVGDRGLLERILEEIHKAGINEFIIVTGYQAKLLEGHFGDGSRFGIEIVYARQTELNGTAAAVSLARDAVGCDSLLLSYGDILIHPQNYASLTRAFLERSVPGVLGVNYVEDPYRGSAFIFEENGRISQIIEKPPPGEIPSRWNGCGVYCFSPILFSYTEKVPLSPRGEYELADAFQQMIDDGHTLLAHPIEGYWGDVGTPEDVEKMTRLLRKPNSGISES